METYWGSVGGGGGGITQRFSISLFLGSFMVCQLMNNKIHAVISEALSLSL